MKILLITIAKTTVAVTIIVFNWSFFPEVAVTHFLFISAISVLVIMNGHVLCAVILLQPCVG